MHTLAQLTSGELTHTGLKRLQIAEQLTQFPLEILQLASTLEVLDLSNNRLSSLPDEFAQLTELKILFLSFNCFSEIPAIIAQCPKLEMIGFKANQITYAAENCFPLATRWLILTDNKLTQLPDSIGDLSRLKKFALAGNQLTTLPSSMQQCQELELLRVSANQLDVIPQWLLSMPKLAWLAFSGNPATDRQQTHNNFCHAKLEELQLGDHLGQGASGVIYQATWRQPSVNNAQHQHKETAAAKDKLTAMTDKEVAVKMFRGAVTSDGYPSDELHCCLSAGHHPNLIKVLAQVTQPGQLGLVMELIPAHFYNLGLPPSLITCTRDTFSTDMDISMAHIIKVMTSMANALNHLHHNQVSHGDIYAHNTMIDTQANMLFGDFGAASDLTTLTPTQAQLMQAIEVRAWGNMLEDLLQQQLNLGYISTTDIELTQPEQTASTTAQKLMCLVLQCQQDNAFARPTFTALETQLNQLG
ncbi:protein kinase [Shewanella intestini]|uniref:Protein kinase n=1 Tax=Shewanella intestini TaxID=2017544 RepID=A0ABS5I1X6_9GAMM|nr:MULTISPECIES: leucine-rich repeat-containing protein kinase family protein [Shewanella]MBR9728036.1 protein kinase [Shewanella intestini]MRG36413.1 protein kinase [Shewanella sp. XMDDZSB0408]